MKIIYNSIIPFPGFLGINICGVLFVRSEYKGKVDSRIIRHESIHTRQILEMGVIFFYLWYVVEYLIRLFKEKDAKRAYRKLLFEQEAYGNEEDEGYLGNRKPYSWIK